MPAIPPVTSSAGTNKYLFGVSSVSNKLSSATHCAGMFVYVTEIDPAAAAGRGVITIFRKVGGTDVASLGNYMLGTDGYQRFNTEDLTDCGASHSYEAITLKEADVSTEWGAFSDSRTDVREWDAAVPKSIHPKITKSLAPNTSPLFVLHGKYNDPARPITLSCQGCMPDPPPPPSPPPPSPPPPPPPPSPPPPPPPSPPLPPPPSPPPPPPPSAIGSYGVTFNVFSACTGLLIGLLISSIIGCCRHQSRTRSRQATPPMLEVPMLEMPVAMPVATPVATVGAIPCGACETAAHSYALFPLQ